MQGVMHMNTSSAYATTGADIDCECMLQAMDLDKAPSSERTQKVGAHVEVGKGGHMCTTEELRCRCKNVAVVFTRHAGGKLVSSVLFSRCCTL